MRILVIYDYSISEAVRKWVQRHPELNGMTYFGNRAEFEVDPHDVQALARIYHCLLYTSPSPRDLSTSRMPSSA